MNKPRVLQLMMITLLISASAYVVDNGNFGKTLYGWANGRAKNGAPRSKPEKINYADTYPVRYTYGDGPAVPSNRGTHALSGSKKHQYAQAIVISAGGRYGVVGAPRWHSFEDKIYAEPDSAEDELPPGPDPLLHEIFVDDETRQRIDDITTESRGDDEPVPEASTFLLFSMGLLGMIPVLRRHKKI